MNKYPLSRIESIVIQNTESEVLIYDTKRNKALCLNETSALVWNLCDGKTSRSEIARKLSERLGEPVSEEFVWLALDQLQSEDLLESSGDMISGTIGLSRREVIRKVGFASIVALPLVTSLVAPTVADAQSCFAIGVNVGATIACPAGPPCSCATVIGGPGASACCSGVAVPGACVPIPSTTSQQCSCVCGVIIT